MLPHFSALFRTFPLLDASTLFRTFPHFSAFSAFSLFSLLTYSLFVFRTFPHFSALHSTSPSLDASALFRTFPHFTIVRCFHTFPHFFRFFTFLIVNLFIVRFLIVLLFHCSLFVYSSDHFLAEVLSFSFRIPC